MNKNLRREEAMDRRLAAIHEAGHVVVGRHLGLPIAGAWLERRSNPGPFEKRWIGHTSFLAKPKPAVRKLAMFSVAGAVAECCWTGCDFEQSVDDDYWLDPEAMSPKDWQGCGCKPGEPTRRFFAAAEKVFSLLNKAEGPLWSGLLLEARRLIAGSRDPISNDDLKAALESRRDENAAQKKGASNENDAQLKAKE